MVSRRSILGTSAAVGAASIAGAAPSHAAAAPKRHRKGTEANKQLVRDYVDQVFNGHQPQLAAEFMAPDVVWHGGIFGTVSGVDNLIGFLSSSIGPVPDLYAAEQDILAEGDLVSARYVVTGTVSGSLAGVPADGRQLRWDAVDVFRIRHGKIVEEWALDDTATMMAQLGAFTPPWAD